MYDHFKNHEVITCEIFLTRRCNKACGACNLPFSGQEIKELDIESWKTVFLNLERIGIKTVKLLGGEPTEKEDLKELLDLISFSKESTHIKLALLSNSEWDKKKWLNKICASGLYAYYASVDTVKNEALCEDSLRKSQIGYQTLLELKKDGRIPLLAANVVMTRKNLLEIPDLVELLSDQGFYVNLCPLQCYSTEAQYENKKITYDFRKGPHELMFTAEEVKDLEKICRKLVTMQQEGALIAVPSQYILNIPKYSLSGGTWQCEMLSQLRLDADGVAMICNEFRGGMENLPKLDKPFENPEAWTKDFMDYWYQERFKYQCQCYWSCFLQANNNFEIGSQEFGFFENPVLHGIGKNKIK